ncbi:MAG TPA: LysM peptidoglycan-binding domain-containing M23 family metallopeptidase [Holophagaceae bacterium]|jgi:murein DD-endopeptidase MepM/ murein hydrolase activator NlpD|nr:LysM peptidoglycan-binding domain-containing M23 family metallopeptidase [Holophagaceae bacterium]
MRHALLTLMIIAMPATAGAHRVRPGHHAKATSSSSVHTVRKGETAGRIAAANGLSVAQLQALNPGRNLAKLSIGTKLHIAAAAAPRIATRKPVAASPEAGTTAVLAKGQTLYALAKANSISVQDLMAANPGLNPRRVRPGTVLQLPGGAPAEADGAAPRVADLPAIPGEAAPSDLPPLPTIPALTAPVVREASLIPSGEPGAEPLLPFRPADPDNLDLLWPVETRSISSYWGPRIRTRVVRVKNRRKKRIRYHGRHKGIDLPAPMHTDIYAAMDGVVVYAGKARGYGNLVTVDHGNGVTTVYGHESVTLVHEGDIVRRGEKIAEVGRAGNATGPHLHFELRVDGVQRNPLPVLDDTEEIPGELAARNDPSAN